MRRWYQPGIQIAAPLFGIGTVILATQAIAGAVAARSPARLMLAMFFFYFMVALPFHAALRTNLIC